MNDTDQPILETTSNQEFKFVAKYIKPYDNILEYGSGISTMHLCRIVHMMVSIEHDYNWYTALKKILPNNVILLYRQPDMLHLEPYDGTYEEFKSYIEAPLPYAPFDLILIDGRARYHCAKFAYEKLSHKDTIFIIHDFTLDQNTLDEQYRSNYTKVLEFLKVEDSYQRVFRFSRK